MSTTWRACPTDDGSWTLWNETLGEGCHSLAGAWQQARERYAGACQLARRARAGTLSVCRLLDIGTGLGLNLAAALEALEPHGVALSALSLELDPTVIACGLALYERAELSAGAWQRWHVPVRSALRACLANPTQPATLGQRGTLALRLGDARLTLAAQPPGDFDAVFLDPFSPRRSDQLWEEGFLGQVARRMEPEAWLSTYSASFRVRLALARSGLRVGRGPRVGAKGEGTLASPRGEPPPLSGRIARRLARRASQTAP